MTLKALLLTRQDQPPKHYAKAEVLHYEYTDRYEYTDHASEPAFLVAVADRRT